MPVLLWSALARGAIADALRNAGARVLDYRIESEGLRLG